ncbi:MAG TPA: aldo/keto reductase [Nitrospira sp.]|nr:aldo/keto reductase [Nitrospira sp.]
METPAGRAPNRLIHETSPYLLQHAYNPVDWYPWGPEALQQAKETNRPILLSIGYSACHWCHVMERESFENESIAAIMNRHFVCIKVDREERPDLDEIYMQATVTLNRGQGGWPMTVFLTPEQQPFFAGTYFPPDDRWGRPGFASLLKKIADVWERDAPGLRHQAQELTQRLSGEWQLALPTSVGASALEEAVREFEAEFDARYGGFGGAPKFPPSTGLSLLLRWYRRSGNQKTLHMVTKTLDAMAAGGLYDHIGGGFARYSTDERWLVPHFEKMLYDNALLTRAYVEAYQVTKHAAYRRIATEVLDYILREMTDPEGGFYSATDADSEGVEGKFFVWTPAEVRAALNDEEEARRFCACYDITESGNWEHQSIPNRLRPIDAVARELNITVDELQESANRSRPLLYRARQQRVPPGLDDKIITAWNGMMISSLAEAGRVLDVPRYIEAAGRAADFLLRVHRTPTGGLLRTSRKGRAHLDAVLEDYAWLGEALVDLYEANGNERYLTAARELAEQVMTLFQDPQHGGFFTTASGHEHLIARAREGPDGATPSGNAVAASLLARLSFHHDRQDFRDASVAAVRAYGKPIARYPKAFSKTLMVVDFLTEGPVELGLVGGEQAELDQLAGAFRDIFLPNRIIARTARPDGASHHPLLAGKTAVDEKAALYICRNFTCQRPITDPLDVAPALEQAQPPPSGAALLSSKAISGFATPEGTARFVSRVIGQRASGTLHQGYVPFGATGLTNSRLGFGCYRVDSSEPESAEALKAALQRGVNLVDTSTNYMDGDSERLVGAVLHELIGNHVLGRDEVIVVSKIGYVQGQNLKQATAREQAGTPYPEMVKYGDGIWHCIHPEFLGDQLTASLDRLGLATLDVCLLHNPEYFLSEAVHRHQTDVARLRTLFYQRIEKAFAYLESQVAAGRIRWYGVSSNTVTADPEDLEATSLTRFLEAAERAALANGHSSHHCAVLQCPMNLFEAGAFLMPNTGRDGKETVLSVAAQQGIAVLINRPLNAMPTRGSSVQRLVEFPLEGEHIDLAQQFNVVERLEQDYRVTLAPSIPHGGQGTAPADFFNWASELTAARPQIQGLEHWEHIEQQMIAPQVNQVLQAVPRLVTGSTAERWEEWRDRYLPQLVTLLRGLRKEATEKSRDRARAVASVIDPLLPASKRDQSLSRKALWIVSRTPGVTCVLNGMRSRIYVEDSSATLAWGELPDVQTIYEAVRQQWVDRRRNG